MRINKAAQRRIQRAVNGRRIAHMQGVKEEKREEANKHVYVQIVRG